MLQPMREIEVIGAEVLSLEAHPKRPGMYRIALRLEKPAQSDEAEYGTDAEVTTGSSAAELETFVTVHEDTLIGWRLLKGRRLTGEEWTELKREEEKEEAYRSALGFLERKARSSKELALALKRKGFEPTVIDGCIERLHSRRMLDDTAFAKRFAEQRAVSQRKGRRLIRQELIQRGIGKADADEAVGELSGEVERQSAIELAHKRWPLTKGDYRNRKHKLIAFLLRRGYPMGVVRQAVDEAALRDEESGRDDDEVDADDMGIESWE
ncbi:regulatory protein RecX [Cohnella faecalis]|uniref:Regulatory protein RecX n=1 Tax=Cohnella faecalis TaxID=2315694 RepID=A0A398CLP5_9BACL|nr:regulatory protein RecX [Cohnella faecalis]RIE03355.1 regulatory protein RecX [Cohnella faecalis]